MLWFLESLIHKLDLDLEARHKDTWSAAAPVLPVIQCKNIF